MEPRCAIQRSASIVHVGLVVGVDGVRSVHGLIAIALVFPTSLLTRLAGIRSIFLVLKINGFLLLPALIRLGVRVTRIVVVVVSTRRSQRRYQRTVRSAALQQQSVIATLKRKRHIQHKNCLK